MFVKLLYFFVVVGVVFGVYVKDYKFDGTPQSPFDGTPQSPFYEIPCTLIGGICQLKGECPEGKQAASGLCPLQQDAGVECCYSVAKSETKCRSNGGECMPTSWKCPMTFAKASDCQKEEKCCILIN